jgi:type III restriction enzyme
MKLRFGEQPYKPYQPLSGLPEVPYACLRLPTGGGKTLLSAHTVALAVAAYEEREFPLTLWLAPTSTIKQQTIETLLDQRHPNREALDKAFDGRVRVLDIADFAQIRPQDIRDKACILVGTFQSSRVENTEIRKIYAHNENLEPHFAKIPAAAPGLEVFEDGENKGKLKFSLVNLLAWHRPLVIVDEAHNAKSELSFDVLNRLNPACVIEYTATPAPNSNVIHSVSAAELKAEEMIKLPIILSEHKTWQQAITASIQTRQKLHDLAKKDKDYIRPIVLFQAENIDREITVDVLLKYLTENENVDRKKIAIATGDQRELDAIDLFDRNCPVEFVITVQALKEGWDCSFAYVLCSVANTRSQTAAEQLLGRVLRMPYAKLRTQGDLNRAYAHVSSSSWPHAVTQLHDRLVSMGFEEQEAEEFIFTQPLPLTGGGSKAIQPFSATLTEQPDFSKLDLSDQGQVSLELDGSGFFTLQIKGTVTESLVEKVSKAIKNSKDRKEFVLAAKVYQNTQEENLSPSQKGEVLSVPQLCLKLADDLELAEKETCLEETGWNLLDYPATMEKHEFSVSDESEQYMADIEGRKVVIHHLDSHEQFSLDGIETEMSELQLGRWVDRRIHQNDPYKDIRQETRLEFVRRVIKNLLARGDMDMARLVRGKFLLEKALRDKIDRYRQQAYKAGFQRCLFGKGSMAAVDGKKFSFKFDPDQYPANLLYDGVIGFKKHYYPRIGHMNTEEAECAQALDRNPLVKFWVKNIERQPDYSFWLPTSSDKFYPDFVAQLNDGRLLVVEYKGGHLKNDDTQEKENVGQLWAEKSKNLFLMAFQEDDSGGDLYHQINKKLA